MRVQGSHAAPGRAGLALPVRCPSAASSRPEVVLICCQACLQRVRPADLLRPGGSRSNPGRDDRRTGRRCGQPVRFPLLAGQAGLQVDGQPAGSCFSPAAWFPLVAKLDNVPAGREPSSPRWGDAPSAMGAPCWGRQERARSSALSQRSGRSGCGRTGERVRGPVPGGVRVGRGGGPDGSAEDRASEHR